MEEVEPMFSLFRKSKNLRLAGSKIIFEALIWSNSAASSIIQGKKLEFIATDTAIDGDDPLINPISSLC
ncbi:MAG: hypothetical protein COA99_14235 [Moraxellaceae bacterium]|nr:MAG: hypothetical protein COA99_14235 [Moraxellaceae bacterium]